MTTYSASFASGHINTKVAVAMILILLLAPALASLPTQCTFKRSTYQSDGVTKIDEVYVFDNEVLRVTQTLSKGNNICKTVLTNVVVNAENENFKMTSANPCQVTFTSGHCSCSYPAMGVVNLGRFTTLSPTSAGIAFSPSATLQEIQRDSSRPCNYVFGDVSTPSTTPPPTPFPTPFGPSIGDVNGIMNDFNTAHNKNVETVTAAWVNIVIVVCVLVCIVVTIVTACCFYRRREKKQAAMNNLQRVVVELPSTEVQQSYV
jgi:hypothetical protein